MGFEELWDGFEKVCKRAQDGETFVASILRNFTKRHKIESEYAKQLTALSVGMADDLEIGTTKEMWVSFQNETLSIGTERNAFCVKLQDLTRRVGDDLKEKKKNRVALELRGQKLVADLARTEETMKRARTKYTDARKLQTKTQQAVEKEKQAGKGTAKMQKEAEKVEKKAEKADNEYRISVNNLKAAQDKFYESDMPALLKEFEEHERSRLENVRDYLQSFVDIWSPISPATKASTDRLQGKVKEVDVKSDLNLYVEQNRPESDQPPARAVYISYDGGVVQDVTGTGPAALMPPPPKEKEKDKNKPEKEGKNKPEKTKSTLFPKKKDKEEGGVGGDEKKKGGPPPSAPPPPADGHKFSSGGSPGGPPKAFSPSGGSGSGDIPPNDAPPAPPGDYVAPPMGAGNVAEPIELVTIYAYDATEDNELTFEEGETIYLIEKDESGWWRGRNKKGVEGVFPSNFVEVVGEEGAGPSGTVEINADYQALYDYEAEDDTELTIKEGEVLHVLTETDGWYLGTNGKGERGNFPSNFVEKLEAKS